MKNKSLPTLNKKLWKIFSEYVRRKGIDEYGYGRCISCGVRKPWKELHAGHYIPKSVSLALRFNEINVNPQCAGCNVFRHGNISQYAIGLMKKHGDKILIILEQIRRETQGFKLSRTDYENLIEVYKAKLGGLNGK